MKLLLLFVVAVCLIGKFKYTSQQKKQYNYFFEIYFYAKTKTIVCYHLCHCLRETRLS